MAAESDDVDAKNEDNILYDLTVLAEWKFDNEIFVKNQRRKTSVSKIGQLSSAAQRITWAFLRTLRMRPLEAAQCSLPEPLMSVVSSTLPWHLAISSSGSLAAVLQDSFVEIRSHRDGFESAMGRGSIPLDSNPQWRCVAWSQDESMVACARSCGVVDVFDMVGTLLFSIPKPGADAAVSIQDLSNSVSALIFTDLQPEDKKWSGELLVIHQGGSLHSYHVDRDGGYSPRHKFLFTDEYPLGVATATYDAGHKVLFVGGAALPDGGQEASASRCDGLTAWRVLSGAPHYKLLTDIDGDQASATKKKSWFGKLRSSSLFSWSSLDVDGLFRLSLSPDGRSLIGLHHSGCLSVWAVPSLRVRHRVPLEEQAGFDEVNPTLAENPIKRKKMKDLIPHKKLTDVNFWSSQAVILTRCSGAVTVSSLASLKNLLGTSPEWFEPSPRVVQAHDGGFLGLECELRFPKQRILVDNEEEFEDSDEEDISMVAMTTRATKQIMFYLTDSERFQPPKKKPRTVTKVYRMVWLKSTTPEELYARKIDAEEYGEALALAQAYGLDCDLVYQRQWRKSPVSLASIQDYLSKIGKRAWVLHECLERVPENIDAARELLQYGLRGTDLPALAAVTSPINGSKFMLCDPEEGLYEEADYDPFNPEEVKRYQDKKAAIRQEQLEQVDFTNLTLEQKEMCRARLKLLQYLDRLKTYESQSTAKAISGTLAECILGGGSVAAERFSASFYKDFRARNIVQLAAEYAQSSDCQALETLFTYHYGDLASHKLALLSNFPETSSPAEYSSLLPELGSDGQVCAMETDMWREDDWSELDICRSAVRLDQEDLGAFLYEESPGLLKFRQNSLEVSLVQDWYESRACQIEASSRLVDNALELIKLAIERGFDGLGELLDDLITMETLVYECGVGDSLTFAALRDMSDYARIELMMDQCPLDSYAKNARRWLVPVLQRCEARDSGAFRRLLHEFLLTRARTDLTVPLKIFQTSKAGVSNPIIADTSDLMEFALEVLFTTERDDQLDIASEIFRCLPQKMQQNETPEKIRLHQEVDHLERLLRAAKILQDNGIQKTLAFIKSSEVNSEEAVNLITRLTRSAGRKSPPLKEGDWYKLHDDIMTLHDIAYRCLSPSLCHQIFVESLLCSGSHDNIRLAGDLMERQQIVTSTSTPRNAGGRTLRGRLQRLDYDIAVTLVLSAAREYFDSSASLTHTCMDLARSCLNLVLDVPPAVQEELDLIASLAVMEDFNVSILPLQVRLCKDRLELVRQAVASKPSNYKQSQKLLRLAHLLRVEGRDSAERDGQVLHVLAQAALAAADTAAAHLYCQQLVAAGYGPAWTVCVDLAEQEGFKDIPAKVNLLSFAVTFCSPEMIEPILQARCLLRRQLLLEKVGGVLKQQQQTAAAETDSGEAAADGPEIGEEDSGGERSHRHGSPFSARAALQQTQAILSTTQRHTRAVLSTVTDTAWWKGAVSGLRHAGVKDRQAQGARETNAAFNRQGCHPFYEDVVDNCFLNVAAMDYGRLEEPKERDLDLSESVLQTARLEEMLMEGEKQDPAEEALLELSQRYLPQDTCLGLAYLLSLPQVESADRCLSSLPPSGLTLELAQYYCCLTLYSALRPTPLPGPAPLYRHRPQRLSQLVLHHVTSDPERSWPAGVEAVVPLLLGWRSKLADWNQAQALSRLAPGVDVARFAADSAYQRETIHGLAMSCDEEVYGMAVLLAQRYTVPLWDIYMAHLEFLFSDSGLPLQDLKDRVSHLSLVDTLRQRPQDFCSRLYTHVYPSVAGGDHPRLLYLFSLLDGMDDGNRLNGLPASEHTKLLKKLRSVAPDIDYVRLMDKDTPPKDILAPYLTTSNINNVMKLAAKIPDKKGGFLHPSSLYCGWAVRVFWEGDKPGKAEPSSAAAWTHRYELCGDYLQRLLAHDFVTFITTVTCSKDSSTKLEVSCRQEIVRRAIKFCQSQAGKKKKENDAKSEEEWRHAEQGLLPLQAHLESLDSDTVKSFLQATDPKFRQYGLQYDLSCGDTHKVGQLLVLMVEEGQPLELVEDILAIAPPGGLEVRTTLITALGRIVAALRGEEEEGGRRIYDPLQRLELILDNVQEHIENEGELASRKDVFEVLHPYVSDSSVPRQKRMAVLELLEKTVGLGAEHASILLCCKTWQVVEPVWGEVGAEEEELTVEPGRRQVFSHLLAATSLASGYGALCRLLQLWPPFTPHEDQESPWMLTFVAMAGSTNPATVALIDTVLKDLGIADFPLGLKDTKLVFDALLRYQHPVEAVKVVLRSNHKQLYPSAVLVLSAEEEVDDSDLVDMVLRRELSPQLAGAPVYSHVTRAVVRARETQGDAAPPHLQLETVVGQLQEAGLQAEARALIQQAQSNKPLLKSVGSALGAVGSWFKS